MHSDRLSSSQILEELADKVAAQIDRRAPVAFEDAVTEMAGYHRFLLLVNATNTTDEIPSNLAELAGDGWTAPHQAWISQYSRLFDRAADQIADDSRFIERLTTLPVRLLPTRDEPKLPASIVGSILDLGAMATPRLEAWRTRRLTVETGPGEAAKPRLSLGGSDAKAFANVMTQIVGNWESLLNLGPVVLSWPTSREANSEVRWARFRSDWPYLWRHLENTAYCLATAVWNEDEIGASLWRDALVRWTSLLETRLDGRAELRRPGLLFPDVLERSWLDALASVQPLLFDHMPPPTPEELFRSVLHKVHGDVLTLTASLLVFWTINDKQSSAIGAHTAAALLRREVNDNATAFAPPGRTLSLRGLFLDCARLRMAGERFADDGYGLRLDRLVRQMDMMTERRIVPGRVYSPSTLHERESLVGAQAAMLAAATLTAGDEGLVEAVGTLATEEALLPGQDRALRNILGLLELYRAMLAAPSPGFAQGVAVLAVDGDPGEGIKRLEDILGQLTAVIDSARAERLRQRPLDQAFLDRLRRDIEAILLNGPRAFGLFTDVAVLRSSADETVQAQSVPIRGLSKAAFVDPPMEAPSSNLDGMLASTGVSASIEYVWREFLDRPRTVVEVEAAVDQDAFWTQIADLVALVGPAPALLIPRSAESRALKRFVYNSGQAPGGLDVRGIGTRAAGWSGIATVNGVDVLAGVLPPGRAWLVSRHALRAVAYVALDGQGHRVAVSFEVGDGGKGVFRIGFKQVARWGDWPVFELQVPGGASVDEEI